MVFPKDSLKIFCRKSSYLYVDGQWRNATIRGPLSLSHVGAPSGILSLSGPLPVGPRQRENASGPPSQDAAATPSLRHCRRYQNQNNANGTAATTDQFLNLTSPHALYSINQSINLFGDREKPKITRRRSWECISPPSKFLKTPCFGKKFWVSYPDCPWEHVYQIWSP